MRALLLLARFFPLAMHMLSLLLARTCSQWFGLQTEGWDNYDVSNDTLEAMRTINLLPFPPNEQIWHFENNERNLSNFILPYKI
jgi:hypothetical protein